MNGKTFFCQRIAIFGFCLFAAAAEAASVIKLTGEKFHTIDLGALTTGGYAVFDVTAKNGEPILTIEYANHPDGLTGKGDFQRETSARYMGETFDLPVLPGNINRHEIYRICRTGRFVAPLIQGQERYVRFRLSPADASVTIENFSITNAEVFAAEHLTGAFRCSDERLNRLWQGSVWTCRLASFPNHNAWKNAGGKLLPRKLERGDCDGWSRRACSADGSLIVTYEFDANPHFPQGSFDILCGKRRHHIVQDGTNAIKTAAFPIRKGEKFGFSVEKESWPLIEQVAIKTENGEEIFRDDFDGNLENWDFTRTRSFMADGAKRDRLVWSGDLWWGERNIFHAFSPDVTYIRDSILMLADNQTPEGYIQASPYPENHTPLKSLEIGPWQSDEFAAWFVPVVWDYLLYTGDIKTAEKVYPNICRLMDYLMANREENGLFKMRPGYLKSIGGDRLGNVEHTAYMNILLWMCYRDAAAIAHELGAKEENRWKQEQNSLAQTIRKNFWNKKDRFLYASLEGRYFRVLDNAFALATCFLTEEEAKALTPRLARFGVGKIQALILRGKFEYGFGDSALRVLDNSNWFRAQEPSWPGAHCTTECMYMMTKSWWDESHPDTALAGQISDYVLGVRPTEPGYRKWIFDPHPGTLAFAEGRVPTPNGVIEVSWQRQGTNLLCRIKEPRMEERQFTKPLPMETEMATAKESETGLLEIYDTFSDLSATPDAFAALEFDLGRIAGLRKIELIPNNPARGWPRNLKVEVADKPGEWAVVKSFDDFPEKATTLDFLTVVGTTSARYIRLSTTRRGPAWFTGNYNLQFSKIAFHFD